MRECVPLSDAEFEEKYGHVFSDPVLDVMVSWCETNSDMETDESAYVQRARENVSAFVGKMKDVTDSILARNR